MKTLTHEQMNNQMKEQELTEGQYGLFNDTQKYHSFMTGVGLVETFGGDDLKAFNDEQAKASSKADFTNFLNSQIAKIGDNVDLASTKEKIVALVASIAALTDDNIEGLESIKRQYIDIKRPLGSNMAFADTTDEEIEKMLAELDAEIASFEPEASDVDNADTLGAEPVLEPAAEEDIESEVSDASIDDVNKLISKTEVISEQPDRKQEDLTTDNEMIARLEEAKTIIFNAREYIGINEVIDTELSEKV